MSEWKKVRLGEVADVKGGKRLPAGMMLTEEQTNHPYIRIRDLTDVKNLEITTAFQYVTDDVQQRISRYIVDEGDVLISIVGTVGLVSIVGRSLTGANLTENCVKIINLRGLDNNYLYYYLKSASGQYQIRNLTVGAVQPKLPITNILSIQLSLPPLPTQWRIAAVLSSLDDKIENNRKICANLEAQAQAIFKSWFVDFEPFGGKMPQGWKMGKLGDVAMYRQCKIAANELTAETYYSTENMLSDKQGLMPATSLPQIGEVPVCEKGDVLISNIRPYFKKICFSWSHGGHSPDVLCLAAKNDNMRYWLYRQLWDDAFFAYVMSSAKGTKMPRGDKEQILAYGMAIPNENDVARFNAVIEPMCESIVSKGIESRALAALRDALLPKLMSGEIDVEKVKISA